MKINGIQKVPFGVGLRVGGFLSWMDVQSKRNMSCSMELGKMQKGCRGLSGYSEWVWLDEGV